jgi:O-antigen ligase
MIPAEQAVAPVAPEVPGPARRRSSWSAGWPLSGLLVLYPLWWALGLGTLIVFVLAVPMTIALIRKRRVNVPPGFGLWLLFLITVVLSTTMLGVNPSGTVPETMSHRLVPVAFNLAGYLSATVILLYAGNLSEEQFPRQRLVRQLGYFFVVVVAGGLLGVVAPTFQFTSPVERLLPYTIATNPFVQSLVHPTAAQLQDVLGYSSPRPSAPFGYTNTWGDCLALLIGFFVVSWIIRQNPLRKLAGVAILLVSAVPIVYSLNRGVWLGIGLAAVLMAVRMAARGRFGALGAVLAGAIIAGSVIALSPLSAVISDRLDHQKSNGIRSFTVSQTLTVLSESPVLGYGSTRAALGSSNSIAVGANAKCQKCGNPTIGSNGQLWLLLVAQGLAGAVLYVGFFIRSLWVYRHDRSPMGDASILALALPLWFMFVYNALTMPLVISFLAIAVLWRNQRMQSAVVAPVPAGKVRLPSVPLVFRGKR